MELFILIISISRAYEIVEAITCKERSLSIKSNTVDLHFVKGSCRHDDSDNMIGISVHYQLSNYILEGIFEKFIVSVLLKNCPAYTGIL